jgi:hypothetical protein
MSLKRIHSAPRRFRWRCSRCRRQCDEPVHYGWGPAWAKCSSCPQTIDLVVKRELDRRIVGVKMRRLQPPTA